jgi:hypothetical protein
MTTQRHLFEIYVDVLEKGETKSSLGGEDMEVSLEIIPDDLELLLLKKALLKQLLLSYEKEYFLQHKCRVSWYAIMGAEFVSVVDTM